MRVVNHGLGVAFRFSFFAFAVFPEGQFAPQWAASR